MLTTLEQNDQNQQETSRNILTICKDCVFSVKDPITNSQLDCSRNRLNKYRSIGVPIKRAEDPNGDYWIVEGRICIFCRDKNWLEKNFVTDAYSYDVERLLIEESTIKYDVIIISNGDYISNKRTIKSLEQQLVKPNKITIVTPKDDLTIKSLVSYFFDHADYKWNIVVMEVGEDVNKTIDGIVESQESLFYTVANAGYSYKESLFGKLNDDIVENLAQIAVILPDSENNGFVCTKFLHKSLVGNRGRSLVNKIVELNWDIPTIVEYIK